MKKTIIIGITSGIAAYKALELIKRLRQEQIEVFVIMTKNAGKVISPEEAAKISGNKVFIELFEKDFDYKKVLESRTVEHIALADKADLMVIVPATANIIAKLAYGIADDFLTTTALAITKPILICPSMNVHMWNHPIVQENITKLQTIGYHVIEPASGMLACGYEGRGRLEDVTVIKNEIVQYLNRTASQKGKKILVTAGGTMEKIDDVRYITNRSSGKMGIAIAHECFLRGADVLLLRAKTSVTPRYAIQEEIFTTAEDLFTLIKKYAKQYDYLYHTAAVADFLVENQLQGKLASNKKVTLQLKPQRKIINQIKQLNPKITLIAFKAEYGVTEKELIHKARQKLEESNADAIIANDISKPDSGFESDKNEVYIVLPDGTVEKIRHTSKKAIAQNMLDYLNEKLSSSKK